MIRGDDTPREIYLGGEVRLPTQAGSSMWTMMERLYPIYRSLCGPGFLESLNIIREHLDIDIREFASGEDVEGWTIPKEFKVNAAWVEDEAGRRIIDFAEDPYAVWIYSQPFDGTVPLAVLREHLASLPYLPDAVPLRQTYYRNTWGLCARESVVGGLTEQNYHVHIDTELYDGFLRIGEFLLPGETGDEILINSYLCHPYGANDNLSGVVVAVELFRQLARLKRRRLSYRLAIWPESIGAITYIARNKDRLRRTVGGVQIGICGDGAAIKMDETYFGDTFVDRALKHALRFCGHEVNARPFSGFVGGSDAGHFNQIGLRIPMATLTRGGPTPQGYKEYHSSKDNLDVVSGDNLYQTLEVLWTAIHVMERNLTYRGTYTTSPFLTRHGVFPFHHGTGAGAHGNEIARAYFELMYAVDGGHDLLTIADRHDLPIFMFDEPVAAFLKAGLIRTVPPGGAAEA